MKISLKAVFKNVFLKAVKNAKQEATYANNAKKDLLFMDGPINAFFHLFKTVSQSTIGNLVNFNAPYVYQDTNLLQIGLYA